jgi:hypothetical protein
VSISETDSKKPRRGRPRSFARKFLDAEGRGAVGTNATLRTQLAHVYQCATIGHIDDLLDEAAQKTLLGGSAREIIAGTAGGPPRGFCSFAVEFGRWAEIVDPPSQKLREHLLEVVEQVHGGSLTLGQAAAHYRKNRLGPRAGNLRALALHLARALDAYVRKFPATSPETIAGAVAVLAETNEHIEEQAAV